MIAEVVRELADGVDWVFFGFCPDALRPYVREYHPGVEIERYPAYPGQPRPRSRPGAAGAEPLQRVQSNLRLLEYGVLGFPVICSDVLCYRDSLPVTRVKNRSRDWLEAIRAPGRCGRQRRSRRAVAQAVRRDWMLEGAHLEAWAAAWLPD